MAGESIAFDIETTGFDVDDVVTTVGFQLPLGSYVLCQTGGRETTGIEAAVDERVSGPVRVETYATEAALLDAVASVVSERIRGHDRTVVAFNGEVWRGGFDLPFLRTRLADHDIAWPFAGVTYADLQPAVRKRFNTTVDGESVADLERVYGALVGGDAGDIDPVADSREAAQAFEAGDIADIVTHNVADIRRTAALADVAERYCGPKAFDTKSLGVRQGVDRHGR